MPFHATIVLRLHLESMQCVQDDIAIVLGLKVADELI